MDTASSAEGTAKRKQEEVVQQLNTDIFAMGKEFRDLVLSTQYSLETRKISHTELIHFLFVFGFVSAVWKGDSGCLADQKSNLLKAENIGDIFTILSSFWSFLDFDLLVDIIHFHGDENDRANMAVYTTNLKQFLNSWRVEPHKICNDESSLRDRAKMYFKLDAESLSAY